MKTLLKILSFAGLALMFAAAVLVFAGRLSPRAYHLLAFVGTVAWFGTVPFWMRRRFHRQ